MKDKTIPGTILPTICLLLSFAMGTLSSCSNHNKQADKGQLLEVFDVHGSEATARLTINGKEVFTTAVYIGKNGIGKTSEGDAKTPADTMYVLAAFGVKPNPGTSFPYIDVTPTTFACDEDCEFYNQIIDTAQVHHPCKGEDMSHIVPAYNYGLATDFNQGCVYPQGSNIFVHCKGEKPFTGGCIALDEECMLKILTCCDQSLVITVRE